jgi:hypothetical protein
MLIEWNNSTKNHLHEGTTIPLVLGDENDTTLVHELTGGFKSLHVISVQMI